MESCDVQNNYFFYLELLLRNTCFMKYSRKQFKGLFYYNMISFLGFMQISVEFKL